MIARFETEFTRPGNATTYTAGDAVNSTGATALTLFSANDIGREGRIIAAKLSIGNSNTTNATFRLFIFEDDANLGTLTDNSAFAMNAAKEEDLIGYTDFTLEVSGTSGSSVAFDYNTGLNIPFVQVLDSAGARNGLYGVLTATGAYDPIGELTVVELVLIAESDPV
jgi:hypothetical protein